MKYLKVALLGITLVTTLGSSLTHAAPKETPPEFVTRIADQLISQLAQNKEQLNYDGAVASQIVIRNIDPHIDTQGFARLVMGTYYADRYSTPEQRLRFAVNFRKGVIKRYAGRLSQYSNEGYTLKPYRETGAKYPVVAIDFKAKDGGKVPVSFQLIDKNNQWKIRNINISGIDLALTFRDQFKSIVQKNGGNLDKAIASFQPDAEAAASDNQ